MNINYSKLHRLLTCFLILISFIIYSVDATGQSYTREDSVKVSGLIKTAIDSIRVNPNKALLLSEEAEQISKDLDYKAGIALSLNVAGNACRALGNTTKAISYYTEAIKIAEKNNFKKDEADALNGLSRTYGESGNYQKAIEQHSLAIAIQESLRDSLGMAQSYNDIATDLYNMQFYDEANKYYFQAIALFKVLHSPLDIAVKYTNIAADYIGQKKYAQAFRYLFQSIHICDSLHDKATLDETYFTLGVCYDKTGKQDSSLYFYFKSLSVAKQNNNIIAEASVLSNIGDIYLDRNRIDEAEKYFKECFDLSSKTLSRVSIHHSSASLAYIAAQKGDYKNAYQYRLLASAANDSLMNEEKIKALAELKTAELLTKFEDSEAEEKNQSLQRENDLQKLRLRQKDYLMAGTGILAVLLIIFAFILVRQNKISAQQQSLELEQKQLRAQMKPHFIFNCLNSIQHFMAHNDIMNANKYLTEFASLMRKTLDSSNSSNISLQNELDYLESYLQLEGMRFENKFRYELKCDNDIDANAIEIPTMIIQPFAENAIRHGLQYLENKEGKLTIIFYKNNGTMICEIDDNGIGREQSRKLKSPHADHHSLGMELTQQRLELIGKAKHAHYKFDVIDKKNEYNEPEGTKVIIQFPLEV
jgi:tetratricopeptide (TPR) repeat protein